MSKHASGALLNSSFIRNVSKFQTYTYPALFVRLKHIHMHHVDIHTSSNAYYKQMAMVVHDRHVHTVYDWV